MKFQVSRSAYGVVALALGLYVTSAVGLKPTPVFAAEKPAAGAETKLKRATGGYPPVGFVDGAGKAHKLDEFKGKVVVMNLWATWCTPCKKEMPTLAALQKGFGSAPIAIVPVSVDAKAATEKAKAFMADNQPLPFFHDAEGAITPALNTMKLNLEGYPATLIYDRHGKLYGVIEGEADWGSPGIKALLLKLSKA